MKATGAGIYLLLAGFIFCSFTLPAQQTGKPVKVKPCLFRGRWQLVKTFSLGGEHAIKKDEYDGIICFRPFHKYFEEVNYESNHWIITGKWHVNRKKKTLELTQRNYTVGKLEDHPRDIIFDIIQTNKKGWAGSSTDKGQPVKVYYNKIGKR